DADPAGGFPSAGPFRGPGAGRLEQPVDGDRSGTVDPLDLPVLSAREPGLPSLQCLLSQVAPRMDDEMRDPHPPQQVEACRVGEEPDALGQPDVSRRPVTAIA